MAICEGAYNSAKSEPTNTRDKWKKKIDFAFSTAGGFVGLGNVWRFPYLCYKNGGGAFLIPYVIFVALGSLPVFFLEVTLGQYTSLSSALAFRIAPLMKGIGIAANIINYYMNVYYAVILAWSLRYFFASMAKDLPWSTCGNTWNTKNCFVFGKNTSHNQSFALIDKNTTASNVSQTISNQTVSSVREFWELGVLGKSKGIGEVGEIQWELLLCLLLTWIVLYFCIWRGIGWTSKVVYFTATFPLIMLLVLLFRGLTLDGAVDGIVFYLRPDLSRLTDVQVWLDAAAQVLYSYALCKGMLITMGSYNNYHYNSYKACIFLSILNSGVSFVSGFAIFSVLGFMAKEQIRSMKNSLCSAECHTPLRHLDIENVAESGPGLAFIAYPKALTMLPAPQFWGCLFFFMLFLLGLDSEFVGQETLMSAFVDLKPYWFKKKWRREILLAFLCFSQFIVGIFLITNGGIYVFHIFDNYAAAGWNLLFICICECVTVAWIFGIDRYWDIVCDMIGFRPRLNWFKWCWNLLTPLSTAIVLVACLVYYKPLTYNKTYVYPDWALVISWILAMSSIIWIPILAVYQLWSSEGTLKERWHASLVSQLDDRFKTKKQLDDIVGENFEMDPLFDNVVSKDHLGKCLPDCTSGAT